MIDLQLTLTTFTKRVGVDKPETAKAQIVAVAGLFSGIGGFERGFSQAGFEMSCVCDSDPDAQAVLQAQFPNTALFDDVSEIGNLHADCHIVTAGFPCQDLSMAGSKKGLAGGKSGVVVELLRLIEPATVQTVVVENVPFMLSLDRGAAMLQLTNSLREMGYDWAYRVVDTMAFGLPQRRRRVYLVASRAIDPRGVLFVDDASASATQDRPKMDKPIGFYWTEGRSGAGLTADAIPPLKVGSALGIASAPAVLFLDGSVEMPSIEASEQLQGFPPGWTQAAHRPKRSPRARLIGNAASPVVVKWVADRIKNPGIFALQSTQLGDTDRWPGAAFDIGSGRHKVDASTWPMSLPARSIASLRDKNWKPLSVRALRGFLSRANEGGLWFPDEFLNHLGSALKKAEALDDSAARA